MKKTLKHSLRVLAISWKANRFYLPLSIFSKVYQDTLYPLVMVILLARIIDMLESSQILSVSDFSLIISLFVVASLLKLTLSSFLDVKQAYLDFKLEACLDIEIAEKLVSLDPATLEMPSFQSLLAQIEGAKGAIQKHIIRLIAFISAIFKVVTAAIVVFSAFPIVIPLILLATIPSYLAWDRTRKKTWIYYTKKRSLMVRVTRYIKTLLFTDSTSKEVAIFKTGPVLLSKIKKHQKKYFNSFNKANNPRMVEIILARILQFFVFIYTQYLNLTAVLKGTLSLGQFALIFSQTYNLATSSEDILNQYSSISARNKHLDLFFKFLETKRKVSLPKSPKPMRKKPYPPIIEFNNVSFRYPGTKRDILRGFNLTINSGEKIALVGENGAGKTTLIKLLLRFHDVINGEVLINGMNIKELDLDEWHKLTGALFQDFIKYQFTFKENVYFGDLEESGNMKLFTKSIEGSGASTYLGKLPKGESQVLGKMFEGGIDLSGGQWQKLALARAFFRNAPILVLDEPTSAIDAKAEYEIFQKVQKLQKDKTVMIISHRFSTVRNADRILVLNEGRIIEEGDHKELMKKKGLYEELFTLQAQGYK
ncbi:ABC transporter ATP-binding protein [Patescibacteria group bacterium]